MRSVKRHQARFELGGALRQTRHQRPISTHLVGFELGEGLGQQLLEALHLELHDLDLRYQARFELGDELRQMCRIGELRASQSRPHSSAARYRAIKCNLTSLIPCEMPSTRFIKCNLTAISLQSHLTHPLRDAEHAVHLAERLAEQPALLVSGVRVGLALLRVKRRLCMQ